jgi:hypothetical protein
MYVADLQYTITSFFTRFLALGFVRKMGALPYKIGFKKMNHDEAG